MRVRLEAKTIPDKPTYIAVDVAGREVHHFRLPPLSQQQRINELINAARGTSGFLEAAAALVGLAWCHETLELEAEYPDDDDDASLRRYSRAVQCELEDEGYSPLEVSELISKVSNAAVERLNRAAEAAQIADFGPPPTDTKTSPSQRSPSSGESPEPISAGPTSSA